MSLWGVCLDEVPNLSHTYKRNSNSKGELQSLETGLPRKASGKAFDMKIDAC